MLNLDLYYLTNNNKRTSFIIYYIPSKNLLIG